MKSRNRHAARVQGRKGSARTAGLILAAAIVVVFAVVVMFFVVRTGPKPEQKLVEGPSATPDPTLVPATKTPTATNVNRLGGGQGFYLQIVDKDDPSRVRAEISAVRSQPVEGQTYRVALERPVIWAFQKDGRTVYARGDAGTAYLPDQAKGTPSKPQDGVLRGNVLVKVFEAKEKGLRPDPETEQPLAVLNTSELRFDAELGQVEAPNAFTVNSWMADFSGSGLTLLYNDVVQRLELLHIASTDSAVVRPAAKAPGKKAKPASVKPGTTLVKPGEQIAGGKAAANGAAGNSVVAKAPTESMYRFVSKDKVTVTQGARSVNADLLEVWVRLFDNELRPGAVVTSNMEPVAEAESSKADGTGTPASKTGEATKSPAAATTETKTATAEHGVNAGQGGLLAGGESDQPVVLKWAGPVEIRPVTSGKPDELAFNDVFVRFTASADDGLKVADQKAKATGSGKLLEYGATRREVALIGAEKGEARLRSEEAGEAFGPSFEVDMVRGIAHVPGKGRLVGIPSKKDGEQGRKRALEWGREAEFQFKLDDRREMTQVLTKVKADGEAKAIDGDGSVAGEAIIGELVPVGDQKSRLNKLSVVGTARATDGKGGGLASDTLEVAFVPTPGKPEESDPSVVVAKGHVVGSRDNGVLNTEWLQAKIARVGEKNQLDATSLEAKDIMFTDANGVTAKAPLLTADPIARSARLQGPAGTVKVSKDGSVIVGQDMTFFDKERRLVVNGAGKLTHIAAGKAADEPSTELLASWTKQMSFDDLSGVVVCVGDADAVMTKTLAGELAKRDTMEAERVDLWLTPGRSGKAESGPEEVAEADRKLIRSEIAGAPAILESRRYAAVSGQGKPALERLMRLKGDQINASEVEESLVVPGTGELIVYDRGAAQEMAAKAGPKGPLDGLEGGGGTSQFTWVDSMKLERTKGLATFERTVKLTHQRAGEKLVTELDCEKLTAVIRETGERKTAGAQAEPEISGELVSAVAQESVWMRYNGREMIADEAHYDAVKRVLNAKAWGENLVQIDFSSGSPLTAKELRWDLVKDRIDITKPGTVVTPR